MEQLIEILSDLKPGVEFTPGTKLIADKIFDSLGFVSLAVELSDEFDVELSPMELIPENFETAETLWKLIQKLQNED